jgi:hypothetical protein
MISFEIDCYEGKGSPEACQSPFHSSPPLMKYIGHHVGDYIAIVKVLLFRSFSLVHMKLE